MATRSEILGMIKKIEEGKLKKKIGDEDIIHEILFHLTEDNLDRKKMNYFCKKLTPKGIQEIFTQIKDKHVEKFLIALSKKQRERVKKIFKTPPSKLT